ncbi:DUF1990 domain-containing protein [Mycolicibacter terrae]|uniref:DUF1990 domain-containing protein n=2 Tax=Mycolicibacter TaxID=1073531 RepID=A0A1A2XKV1_MYCSD|nr:MULTISPECIES: DUF1990 domain-containing protein [Mycolicibacter]OBH20771.1 hypothetical protein A5694_15410 [Mycolicibacter sinensis]OBI25536.1 hypothetical protein A5710_09020 [Mycolicibacter sinensis]RRR47742.1 DUF1990 domain-containing protein [Mycolicibacter terrae]
MDVSKLRDLPLTYAEVGATAGALPQGYQHLEHTAPIGRGRQRFEEAGAAVLRWGMQRGAGLGVRADSDVAAVGTTVVVRMGFLSAPCRVVYVIDEPDRRGFAYGTLPGHPESGEEFFAVRYDPAEDTVYAQVRAFSRPAKWWIKAGGPVVSVAQRLIARRYLRAV